MKLKGLTTFFWFCAALKILKTFAPQIAKIWRKCVLFKSYHSPLQLLFILWFMYKSTLKFLSDFKFTIMQTLMHQYVAKMISDWFVYVVFNDRNMLQMRLVFMKKKLLNQNDFKILRNEHFELAIHTGISIINQWILCLWWPSRALLKILKLQNLLSEKFNFCTYFQFLAFFKKKRCVYKILKAEMEKVFFLEDHTLASLFIFLKNIIDKISDAEKCQLL